MSRLGFSERGTPDLPPVLFLHGFLGAGGDWAEMADALGQRYRCILVDLPGHAASTSYDVPDMPAAAQAILSLADSLGIDRFALVGYSMGGRLALYLALMHPDRVTRAVLESASPGLRTEDERAARQQHDERLAAELETDPLPDVLARWYMQPLFGRMFLKDPQRFAQLLARRVENDPRALVACLRALGTGRQPSLWENLRDNRLPMLFIAGERDSKYVALAREMVAATPQSAAKIFPHCAHNVHFERPEEYTRLLSDFLGSRD